MNTMSQIINVIEFIWNGKAVLFCSSFFVVGWTEPYVWGIMLHHFISRNWGRATIWLLGLLAIQCFNAFIVLGALMSDGEFYRHISSGKVKLGIWVLLGQALFWAAFWRKHRIDDDAPGWRTVAIVAFIASLLFALTIYTTCSEKI